MGLDLARTTHRGLNDCYLGLQALRKLTGGEPGVAFDLAREVRLVRVAEAGGGCGPAELAPELHLLDQVFEAYDARVGLGREAHAVVKQLSQVLAAAAELPRQGRHCDPALCSLNLRERPASPFARRSAVANALCEQRLHDREARLPIRTRGQALAQRAMRARQELGELDDGFRQRAQRQPEIGR